MKRTKPLPAGDDEREAEDEDYLDPNYSLASNHQVRADVGLDDAGVDSDDPNLSALYAEAGAEDRLREIGL